MGHVTLTAPLSGVVCYPYALACASEAACLPVVERYRRQTTPTDDDRHHQPLLVCPLHYVGQ